LREYFLDARALEHPEPLKQAIDILKNLDNKSYCYMIHRKEPIPLLALANEHKLNTVCKYGKDETWHILISPNSEVNLEEYIRYVSK